MNPESAAGKNSPTTAPTAYLRDPADLCGCVPAPVPDAARAIRTDVFEPGRADRPPMSSPARGGAVPATTLQPSRALKLVVTLRPRAGAPIAALLAVGADGCDPIIQSITVDDLHAALVAVSALVAEAEARWADQPRYAAVAAQPDGRQLARRHPPSNTNHPRADTTTITVDAPAHQADSVDLPHEEPEVEQPTTAQLSLFEPS